MRIAILLVLATLCGLIVMASARKRAEREAAEAMLAKARAARKPRVPEVSNNLKGVTASQTIQPYKPEREKAA
jgi:hypothetical protein